MGRPETSPAAGLRLEDLPEIDLILLTHNHWDHLDIRTLKKLNDRNHPKFITTLGVDLFLKKQGIHPFAVLDWWGKATVLPELTIEAVPAQHFSGRGILDRDATLWAGYVLRRSGGNIYFAGDTGYNPSTFKEIGTRCAPVSIAIIPIGAYKPKWFMFPVHCSPEEAVSIHQEVGAGVSIGCHFGTFQLADDGKDEPTQELSDGLKQKNVDPRDFLILREGIARQF